MKTERQIEEMARLDGWEYDAELEVFKKDQTPLLPLFAFNNGSHCHAQIPDYLHDLNACHRVLKGLDNQQLHDFYHELHDVILDYDLLFGDYDPSILLATAEQVTEAILRAVGKWEEGA